MKVHIDLKVVEVRIELSVEIGTEKWWCWAQLQIFRMSLFMIRK